MTINPPIHKKRNLLGEAQMKKRDEFYTQLSDIEKELVLYKEHFKNKVVYCNCDDPLWSNFFLFFVLNFNSLGLRGLIATCYSGSLSSDKALKAVVRHVPEHLIPADYDAGLDDAARFINEPQGKRRGKTANVESPIVDFDALFSHDGNELTELTGDGDFRSPECVELLRHADIICTNPPFSLFREYIALLMEHEKKFIVMGNLNAVTYSNFFPLLKEQIVHLGTSIGSGDKKFNVPDSYEINAASGGIDENGRKYIRFKNVRWYHNLHDDAERPFIKLTQRYDPKKYPRYLNCDAIEVGQVSNIPYDYDGNMGVPITFMDKWNPQQFTIIGDSRDDYIPIQRVAKPDDKYISSGASLFIRTGEHELRSLYRRIIIIRNLHVVAEGKRGEMARISALNKEE